LNGGLKKTKVNIITVCFSLDSSKSILGHAALYAVETDFEILKFHSALSSSRSLYSTCSRLTDKVMGLRVASRK
jgi:hypothetical protein